MRAHSLSHNSDLADKTRFSVVENVTHSFIHYGNSMVFGLEVEAR